MSGALVFRSVKMRRFLAVILVFVMIALSGCAAGEPLPGEELILAAREWYTSLDSARVEVVNDATGEAEQVFIFKYDEKDFMTYSYVGTSEGIYLAQYNNGREQFTNDNGEISALEASSLNFTAYSRDVPYPMADEGLILFYKRAVIAEESSITEGTVTTVTHVYDPEKLGTYDGEGTLIGFIVSYRFDMNGIFTEMTETTKVQLDDGTQKTYSYTIYIKERNSIERVENVVDISSLKD